MSEYARYPEYKDSGVPWLGEIPSHWQISRLKNEITFNDETLSDTTDLDYEILYVDISSVSLVEGITKKEPMTFETSPSRARRIAKSGDVIVSTVRTYLKAIAQVEDAEDNLIVSTGFAVLRPKANVLPKFLGYWVQSEGMVGAIVANSVGVSYPAINASDLVRLPIVNLPFEEQAQIANFLDHELGKIDALIDKQQLLLDKLAEQRSAVITQAVTKGLNPNADMKDSGVAWLGNTPYNWEVKKIRYLIDKIYTGSTPPTANSEYYDEGDWNWFNPADFKKSLFLSDSKKKLNSLAITENKVDLIPKNSVLIIGIGATLGKVALAEVDCSTNQQINSLIINKANSPKFITYALSVQREIMSLISNSATLAIMNQEKTKSIILAVPPLAEQNNIVKHLDQETQKIDQMTETVNRTIERLKEYRSTLITQAVTGKIKVF